MGIPLIFAGIRTASLFVISTTTIASLTGYSGTLGDIVNNEASYHLSGVIGSAYCIAALALAMERMLAGAQRLLTPRGLVLAGRASLKPRTSAG
jgi:osmoprotectant transport system permease protein